jgi:hypothetical protein
VDHGRFAGLRVYFALLGVAEVKKFLYMKIIRFSDGQAKSA